MISNHGGILVSLAGSAHRLRPVRARPRAAVLALGLWLALCGCGEADRGPAADAQRPPQRLLIVGWDGATFDLVDPLIAAGRLPHLAALIECGVSARLASTIIPISSAAWTSAVTGKGPGKTGVYGFLEPIEGSYDARLISARSNHAAPLWRILSAHGLTSHVFGVPVTWPPEAVRGTLVSGLLSPFDAVYTHPPQFGDALRARGFVPDLGVWQTAERSDRQRFYEQLALKRDVLLELLESPDWDFSMVVFKSLDVLSHRFYDGRAQGPVADWLHELDAVLGALRGAAGPMANTIVMSDHGFAAYTRSFNLHAWLIEEGFTVRSGHAADGVAPGPLATQRVEAHRRRFAELDLAKTRAFATASEGNFGSLRLNLRGREPQGAVAPEAAEALLREIEARLSALRFAGDGPPLVRRVLRGEAQYPGPERAVVPDLLIETRADVKVVSNARGPVFAETARTRPDHAREGILAMCGPGIAARPARAEASILDIAPTALHLLGQPTYAEMDGRVRTDLLADATPPRVIAEADDPQFPAAPEDAFFYSDEHLDDVVRRLEALGYVH
ncbi:MAG TPA: alkaline phosphatase family protein [Myxococcota bacterium]